MLKKDENYRIGRNLKVIGGIVFTISLIGSIAVICTYTVSYGFGLALLFGLGCLLSGCISSALFCCYGGMLETQCKLHQDISDIKKKYLNIEEIDDVSEARFEEVEFVKETDPVFYEKTKKEYFGDKKAFNQAIKVRYSYLKNNDDE